MNTAEKQKVITAIQHFNSTEAEFEKIAVAHYSKEQTLDSIFFQDYSLGDLFALSRDIVKKVSIRIEQENWQVLPFTSPNLELGQFHLSNCITEMTNFFVQPNQYNNAALRLKALILYSIQNCFWTTSEQTDLEMQKSSFQKLEERVKLTVDHIDKRVEIANKTITTLNDKTSEIDALIAQKHQQFSVIQNNQNQSNTILNDISNTKQNADNYETEIGRIKNKCSDILSDLEKKQDKIGVQQQEVDKQIETANSNLTEFEKDSKDKIDTIKSGYDAVSSYVNEVKKMMGYISDGTLSHSFNQQKTAIKKNVRLWMWISFGMMAVLIAWVVVVFVYLSANTNYVWADIIINGIKVSPVAFAFGFALTRYSRERNLQEEYAFRESVAATLTAYLEQLKGDSSTEFKNMLTATVEKLYTKPILSAKEYKIVNLDSKDLSKIIENLLDTIKESTKK